MNEVYGSVVVDGQPPTIRHTPGFSTVSTEDPAMSRRGVTYSVVPPGASLGALLKTSPDGLCVHGIVANEALDRAKCVETRFMGLPHTTTS